MAEVREAEDRVIEVLWERDEIASHRDRLELELADLKEYILDVHVEGFNQAA